MGELNFVVYKGYVVKFIFSCSKWCRVIDLFGQVVRSVSTVILVRTLRG